LIIKFESINDLKNELINIFVNYYFLVDVITKLETQDLTLLENLSVAEEVITNK
jgi:hypothetical protein